MLQIFCTFVNIFSFVNTCCFGISQTEGLSSDSSEFGFCPPIRSASASLWIVGIDFNANVHKIARGKTHFAAPKSYMERQSHINRRQVPRSNAGSSFCSLSPKAFTDSRHNSTRLPRVKNLKEIIFPLKSSSFRTKVLAILIQPR